MDVSLSRNVARCAVVCVAAVAVWYAGSAGLAWQRRNLAQELALQAANSQGSAARVAVEELVRLGPAGIEPLAALAMGNSAAGLAARESLEVWVGAVRRAELESNAAQDAESQATIQTLAAAVARSAGDCDWQGMRWSSRLALDMLPIADAMTPTEAWRLTDACDRILATCQRSSAGGPRVALAAPRTPRVVQPAVNESEPAVVVKRTHDAVAAPPAGVAQIEVIPRRVDASGAGALSEGTGSGIQIKADAAEELRSAPLADEGLSELAPAQPLPAPTDSSQAIEVPTPRQMQRMLASFRQRASDELAAQQLTAARFERLAIQQVLREREAAKVLSAARNIEVRSHAEAQGVLAKISDLPPEEARATLRALVVDPNPEVRLEALGVLATSSDPRATEIFRRRVIEDSDPRVAELAEKILKSRTK